jgi:hypothetical protein
MRRRTEYIAEHEYDVGLELVITEADDTGVENALTMIVLATEAAAVGAP